MWLIAIVLACFAGYHMCALSLSCCMRSIGRCSCAALRAATRSAVHVSTRPPALRRIVQLERCVERNDQRVVQERASPTHACACSHTDCSMLAHGAREPGIARRACESRATGRALERTVWHWWHAAAERERLTA